MPTLTVSAPTVAKRRPIQSSALPTEEKAALAPGSYPILAYGDSQNGHILVTFDPAQNDLLALFGRPLNTWHLWSGHCSVEGNTEGNNPRDEPRPPAGGLGIKILLPGFAGEYRPTQPVHRLAPNITWGELLHANPNGTYRRPETAAIVNNLIQIGIEAQKLRDRWGGPLIVHSGYRDRATNARIGGASQSQHVLGNAIDFSIPGKRPSQMFDELDATWPGGLAYSDSGNFLHIDRRSHRARWVYPGG